MTSSNVSLFSDSPCVCFITLGCAKNEVDSVHMRESVSCAGFTVVDDPSYADVVVVNTCSFIEAATEESLEVIFDLNTLPRVKKGETKLLVAGCMPARYGETLKHELTEADAFLSCKEEEAIVATLHRLLSKENSSKSQNLHIDSNTIMKSETEGKASVYVKISEGCDRFCAYCTIPFIRGPYRSFSIDAISKEIDTRIKEGAQEIVLIAQDTGRWGEDFEEPSSLAVLLETLAKKYPKVWLRVMYLQPEGITDELLEVMAEWDTICNYLDIPLQHVDSQILKTMNRHGSEQEFYELIARIRKRIPDVTLRTTLIAGFPGESEKAFEALCNFVEQAAFDYVGVFPYSQEEGTLAATLKNQISDEEKRERAQQLRDAADCVGIARVAQRSGNSYSVLVLGQEEDGQLYGRTQGQAPEVDGVVYLEEGEVGTFRTVIITDTLLYEMEGR